MAERAAHLVDHVFPAVPIRQWVLTLPHRMRYAVAWDHALCRAVLGVFTSAVRGFLRRRARRRQGVADGRAGAVVIIQRFGVHAHALVLDGVFAEDGAGGLRFHPATPPGEEEMGDVLGTIEWRVRRLLARRGFMGAEIEGAAAADWMETEPLLAGLAGASVQGRLALGPRAGAELRRCGSSPDLPARAVPVRGPCHAHRNGFDLHAGVIIPGRDRARLERVCRYALRPPVPDDRLRLTETGDVLLELRRRWSDGTTHLRFAPLELLERLAAVTPRPRINLVLYYGVLGAHAAWRPRLPGPGAVAAACEPETVATSGPERSSAEHMTPTAASVARLRGETNRLWAHLMARSFGYDVLGCPRCGGRLRLVALIDEAAVIQRILGHLGLPTEVPQPRPARAPPIPWGAGVAHLDDDLAVP